MRSLMQIPWLSILILLPLATAMLLLALPAARIRLIRWVSLSAALVTFAISVSLFIAYDEAAAGYQFIEQLAWLPAMGISYHVGIDGISAALELMAGIVVLAGVLVTWQTADRAKEYFSFLMFLAASVFGVFASLDLFQLFFFFELAVFPKYLMIVMWGSPKTREYGGMKLTLYLFLGSVIALVGVLAVYFQSGLHTFNLLDLEKAGFGLEFQRLWFPFIDGQGRSRCRRCRLESSIR